MKKVKNVLFFVFLTLQVKTWAYTAEEGNITATFGILGYKTNFDQSATGAISPYLGAFGITANGDINEKGSLEISIFDMNKLYIREVSGKYISERKEVVHITMGYRWWFHPKFTSSLTFYSSYSLAEPAIVHSDFPVGTQPDTSARDTTEYGFDLAAQTPLLEYDIWGVVAEARYSFSVTSKPGENSDHYGLFLGMRRLLESKRER